MGYQTNRCIHRKGMIKIKLGKEIIMYENSHVKHSDIEKQKTNNLVCYMRCSVFIFIPSMATHRKRP